ncbi:hypothetical protein [Pontibacter sp. G13]|uniref:hypothetical protein n=1 Tax=Pontibacter sp. G13 TaxID=3074898 RepID=UPI00288AD659|nr:hypothetical protein [Pontibacter sp. G13]WNJ20914.1 hypothetical protein RJD25_10590 [Pontibacter sp. G13]
MIKQLAPLLWENLVSNGIELMVQTASEWSQFISIFLFSSVKFFLGVVAALALPGFDFWELILAAGGGAWVGSVVMIYFGASIRAWSKKYIKLRKKPMSFARRRQIYKIWHRYGLTGVVFLIPLISPMIAIGIALSFQEKPRRILSYITVSIFAWTAIFGLFKEVVLDLVQ